MTLEERTLRFFEKAKSVHGDYYDYSLVEYKNNSTKVEIICPIHGLFWQEPAVHTNQKCGCPACGGRKQSNTKEFIEKARKVHGDKYDYSLVKYKRAKSKVGIICPNHGVFEATPDNHLRKKGCPDCYNDWRKGFWGNLSEGERLEHGQKIREGYFNMSDEDREKMLENKSRARDAWWKGMSEEEREVYRKKIREGKENPPDGVSHSEKMKKYWRDMSEEKFLEIRRKSYETKKKKGSFSTSQAEEVMWDELREFFGKDDVLREYIDEVRYPFSCDFYIKPLDLFIELNAHWTHDDHFFDENDPKDLKKLAWLSQKAEKSRFYQNKIDVWTKRDIIKRETARQNNLNYLVFWDNDLTDFRKWLYQEGDMLWSRLSQLRDF